MARCNARIRVYSRRGSRKSICIPHRHYASLRQMKDLEITEDDRQRIYILGTGQKQLFYRGMLRLMSNPPPVTMLTTNNKRIESFYEQGGEIRIIQEGHLHKAKGTDMETLLSTDPNLRLNSQPLRNQHIHFGRYVLDQKQPSAFNQPNYDSTQNQTSSLPQPIPDLRNLYQKSASRRPQRRRSTPSPEPARSTAQLATETVDIPKIKPILNLIIPTDRNFRPDLIHTIKHRTSCLETTVFVISTTLGLIEHWNETVFQDPRTRPNYFRGVAT